MSSAGFQASGVFASYPGLPLTHPVEPGSDVNYLVNRTIRTSLTQTQVTVPLVARVETAISSG